MDHLYENSILCDNQHGFRSKRSCETQLVITIEEIARKLANGEQVDIILLDFSKAFDKVPHRRLLHKPKYYGIRNNTFLWIQDFLNHRTQEVQLEGHKSTTADVLSGVPQGTVLGPCSSYYSSTIYPSQLNPMPDCSACCFVQYEIIGIHRSCRTSSTQWKNGRIDGRWPSIQKGVW
jgi:hypothetical protein